MIKLELLLVMFLLGALLNAYYFFSESYSQPAETIVRERNDVKTSVSGDAFPHILKTDPNSMSKQVATILVEAKIPTVGYHVPAPKYTIEWKGCLKWVPSYVDPTRGQVSGHWERPRVADTFNLYQLGPLNKGSSPSPNLNIYKSTMEGSFPVGNTTLGCRIQSDETLYPEDFGDPIVVYRHSGMALFTILVKAKDVTPPTITGPETKEFFTVLKSMPVNYSDFLRATDDTSTVDLSCNPPSGSTFDIGITTVTCTAKDAEGNVNTKTFKVDIQALTKGEEDSPECKKMEIKSITANSFETDPADYHPASDAVDGKSSTWWSNQGENSWLKLDLGDDTSLCKVQVEWNKGDERKYTFEISASKNGNEFKQIFDGTNQKGSSSVESYQINDANGRYLMIKVTGSSSHNGWVSIKEIGVFGKPVS